MADFQVHKTPDNGESTTRLLKKKDGKHRPVVLYSLRVWLEPGDVIDVVASGEFSVDRKYTSGTKLTSMVGSRLIIGDSPIQQSGVELCESTSENVTKDEHHKVRHAIGKYKVPANMNGWKYINYVCYSSKGVKVEQDYGGIQMILIRP